jgi:diaminopropionate ammonia-lyase
MAWPILKPAADAYVAIPDEEAPRAMRLLAQGVGGDQQLTVGESGVAGLAGLLRVAASEPAREALSLGSESRVLVVGTEGATDPVIYRRVVGG